MNLCDLCLLALDVDWPNADPEILNACALLMSRWLQARIDDHDVDADDANRIGAALGTFLVLPRASDDDRG